MNLFNTAEVPFDLKGKPFLRWIGGKNWLIPHISFLTSKIKFRNYHEPFFGGGSVFFSLKINNKSFISDSNIELINTYKSVKKNPKEVCDFLSEFDQNEEFYYYLRSQKFNDPYKEAARFIHLNKTSFNGLYRVNSKGKYNVAYGKKTFNLNYLNGLIHFASKKLKSSNINECDFKETLSQIKKGDLVYLDPPYTITNNKNGFIKYNEKQFSYDDQIELSNFIKELKNRGAYYILSNAHHPDIKKIYYCPDDNIISLTRGSVVGAKIASRGKYKEYLFTNII